MRSNYLKLRAQLVYLRKDWLRKEMGMTQKNVAELMGVNQSEVSRFEKTEDPSISTVAYYVEALGGRLEMYAVARPGVEWPVDYVPRQGGVSRLRREIYLGGY